ncbi:MAG: hypothetical protein LBH62_05235 [Nitrososphaerota archaeon]|nr:hypothetical protein [Nitrososphaerota archaeon]
MPRSSEVHWRKLLASHQCKNDVALLLNGNIASTSAFMCADKFANENQKPVYEQIKKIEEHIKTLLLDALFEHEIDTKRKTSVEKLVTEYNEKISVIEISIKEQITQLEEIEKALHENAIDCTAIADEFKSTINFLLDSAKKVSDKHRDEISLEEKDEWTAKLHYLSEESSQEYRKLTQLEFTHPKFLEHTRLTNLQKNLIIEIEQKISDTNIMQASLQKNLAEIDRIIKIREEAINAVHEGNYAPALTLLSHEYFMDTIAKTGIHKESIKIQMPDIAERAKNILLEEEAKKKTLLEEEAKKKTLLGSFICEIVGVGHVPYKQYRNLGDALAEVQNGETIRLLANINYKSATAIMGISITFDVNGFVLNIVNKGSSGNALTVNNGGVTLIDTSMFGDGALNVFTEGTDNGVYAINGSRVTVTNAVSEGPAVWVSSGAVVTVEGEIISGEGYAYAIIGGSSRYEGNGVLSTTNKRGYIEYTDGVNSVWVKIHKDTGDKEARKKSLKRAITDTVAREKAKTNKNEIFDW